MSVSPIKRMSEREISDLEMESVLIGLLGAEHSACLHFGDLRREWEEIVVQDRADGDMTASSSWPVEHQFLKAIDCFVKSLPERKRIALALTIIGAAHNLELEM